MKAELIKRLFRSVAAGSEKDLFSVCSLIIEDEKKRGHAELAKQLGVIISTHKELRADHNHSAKVLSKSSELFR